MSEAILYPENMDKFRTVEAAFKEEQKHFQETKEDFDASCVKYKRCGNFIVMLYIPKDVATTEERKKVVDSRFAKFCVAKAYCCFIFDILFEEEEEEYVWSNHMPLTAYEKDTWITPDGFDNDIDNVCSRGIHYFNSLQGAYYYARSPKQNATNHLIRFKNNGSVKDHWVEKSRFAGDLTKQKEILEERFGISNLCF